MCESFGGNHKLKRKSRHQDEVERAVLVIVGEQAVEGQQRREECAKPQDGRPDSTQQSKIGTDRERHKGHYCQEKKHTHHGSATDPDGNARIAGEQGGERCHCVASRASVSRAMRESARPVEGVPNRNSSGSARPSGPWVAAMMRPPPDKW